MTYRSDFLRSTDSIAPFSGLEVASAADRPEIPSGTTVPANDSVDGSELDYGEHTFFIPTQMNLEDSGSGYENVAVAIFHDSSEQELFVATSSTETRRFQGLVDALLGGATDPDQNDGKRIRKVNIRATDTNGSDSTTDEEHLEVWGLMLPKGAGTI